MRIALAFAAALGGAAPALAADADHPAVVELFQSQGCSSCPAADAVLNALADRQDVLALNFAVTYWDQLGWKDSFAQPAFTKRQWDYARTGGRTFVATPQMIVNGRAAVTGNDPHAVAATIRRADRTAPGPAVTSSASRVAVGRAAGARAATVWLIRYDPRTIQVAIRAGENAGRTLPHRDIVRELTKLGRWTGADASFALPAPAAGLSSAILVQQDDGAIVAARRIIG